MLYIYVNVPLNILWKIVKIKRSLMKIKKNIKVKQKTLFDLNIWQTLHNIMDEATLAIRYIGLLIVTFFASAIKTLFFRIQYGMMMNDVICIELAIAIVMTQIYLIYARRWGYFNQSHIVKVILANIIFTSIAWISGTSTGLHGLATNPNIYH